jgi:hypothetical protein
MQKQADTFSEQSYDTLLNTLIFFFGVDIEGMQNIPDIDLTKLKDLELHTDIVEDEKEKGEGLPFTEDVGRDSPIWIEEPEIDKGEVVRNQYMVNIPPMLANRLGEPQVDHSYPTLKYLESLGYETFDFIVNPHPHNRVNDICDEVARGGPHNLTALLLESLDDAEVGGHRGKPYPVAPIFYLTHIGSKGYLHVYPPVTADKIPNNAPGLIDLSNEYNRQWDGAEILLEEKTKKLQELKPVEVNSLTLPPDMFKEMEVSTSSELRQEVFPEDYQDMRSLIFMHSEDMSKIRRIIAAISEIKPITIKKTVFIKQPNGFIQIILKDFKGFMLEKINDIAKVYINEFENAFYMSADNLEFLNLTEDATGKSVKENDFVLVDGSVAIAVSDEGENEELGVFLPEYETFAGTDVWQLLEIT